MSPFFGYVHWQEWNPVWNIRGCDYITGFVGFLDDQWTYSILVGYSKVKPVIFLKFQEGPSIVLI